MPKVLPEHIYYASSRPDLLASIVGGSSAIDVATGVGAGSTITLTQPASAVLAVLAVVTATGAFASKALLAVTTDYTFSATTNKLTCVTAQTANTLIVIYK